MADKLEIVKAYLINFSAKLLFFMIGCCFVLVLFWMILNRHEIPVSAIYQSDAFPLATLANFVINQSFDNLIVVVLVMSAIYCALKNKESLIMRTKCLCGQKITTVINASDVSMAGKSFYCETCQSPGWIDAETGKITLISKKQFGHLENIARENNLKM